MEVEGGCSRIADDKEGEACLNPNYIKEWENSRGVLGRFDGYLNDLRKYGFTLITGILAVSAFLLPYSSQTDPQTGMVTSSNFPDEIKFVVLLVNLLIIVAITALDRHYTVFLKAAATRARVLERALNLELTDIITQRYRSAHSDGVITGLYVLYMIMALVLGIAVLGHTLNLFIYFLGFFLAALGSIFVIRHYLRVNWRYGPIDYTLDRLHCTQGDTVAITLTNLEKMPLVMEKDMTVYEIRHQNGTTKKTEKVVGNDIIVDDRKSYTWLWDVKKDVGKEGKEAEVVEAGIYVVWRPEAIQVNPSIKDKLLVLKDKVLRTKKKNSEKNSKEKYKEKAYTKLKDEKGKTILHPLTKKIRVYKKTTAPSQTKLDEKLKLIKEILKD